MPRRFAIFLLALFLVAPLWVGSASANMAPPLDEFRLGLSLTSSSDGPKIAKVDKGSVAAKAGVEVGDVILAIDRRYAKTYSKKELKAFAGDVHVWPVEIIVLRKGREVITLRLESAPIS